MGHGTTNSESDPTQPRIILSLAERLTWLAGQIASGHEMDLTFYNFDDDAVI